MSQGGHGWINRGTNTNFWYWKIDLMYECIKNVDWMKWKGFYTENLYVIGNETFILVMKLCNIA